jgi:hypothetical protein
MTGLCFCLRSLFAETRRVISGLLEAQYQTNALIPSFRSTKAQSSASFFQIEMKIKKRAAFAFCYGPTYQFG